MQGNNRAGSIRISKKNSNGCYKIHNGKAGKGWIISNWSGQFWNLKLEVLEL